jgi:hypothetical protein
MFSPSLRKLYGKEFFMPFHTSQDPPDPNSDIRIFFEGLVLLTPVQENGVMYCHVRAIKHQHAGEHDLVVEVGIDEPQPTLPFLRIGKKVIQKGLRIYTDNPQGVTRFDGTTNKAFPFAEAIDFQVINPGHTLNQNGLHKAISISDGILYTATHRTDDVSIESQNTPCAPRHPVSLILGANIVLGGRKCELDWGDGPFKLEQDQNGEPKYLIWIHNSRSEPLMSGNDFDMFYEGLNGVDDKDKFSLKFAACGHEAEHKRVTPFTTPRIPCIPGVDGG